MSEGWKVTLNVDGKTIPLNPFVQKFISSTITGMLSSLRDVSADFKKAVLTLEREA